MSNNLNYKVEANGKNIKIRDYMKYNLGLSGRFTRDAGMEKRIKVNGKNVNLNYKLQLGDCIEVIVEKQESQNIIPEDLNIEVIYEDSDLLVVNKKPFMVVHPTRNNSTGTLANGILYHFKQNNENCIVRLVSRLDRDTSGLIIIAKNQFTHMNLAKIMEENKIVKSYLAVIHGHIIPDSGTIDLPIGRESEDSPNRVVRDDGQRSITHYKTIEKYKNDSLVELTLETGRTHQIRVHLSHLGNPIYGDSLYGKEESNFINRQALHAYKLVFPHPRTGDALSLTSEIPEDIKNLINKIN